MSSISTNDFRAGVKVMLDNDPCSIVEKEFVKPGKGQAFNRVRIRNLRTGRVIERTFKSGDTLEAADVVDVDMQFLYADGQFWHFMNPESYEQLAAGETAVGDASQWLKDGTVCIVTLWNGQPLSVTPPPHVERRSAARCPHPAAAPRNESRRRCGHLYGLPRRDRGRR